MSLPYFGSFGSMRNSKMRGISLSFVNLINLSKSYWPGGSTMLYRRIYEAIFRAILYSGKSCITEYQGCQEVSVLAGGYCITSVVPARSGAPAQISF